MTFTPVDRNGTTTDPVARTVELAGRLAREREQRARRASQPATSRDIDALEIRLERLEAAIYALADQVNGSWSA